MRVRGQTHDGREIKAMTAIRPEKLGEVSDTAAAAGPEFEGEIREFVRRDVSIRRKPRSDLIEELRSESNRDVGGQNMGGQAAAESIGTLIGRVSSAATSEIDRVIGDLTAMRETLRNEGDRVKREITGYADLSQTAMATMKVISEGLGQWKPASLQARPDAD
jgi:hypothetical protein